MAMVTARLGVPVFALLVLLLALVARLAQLDATAGSSGANHDEGVYASAAHLLLRGVLPYRDYVHVHPPASVLIFSPAMLLESSAWGDPAALLAGRQLRLRTASSPWHWCSRSATDSQDGGARPRQRWSGRSTAAWFSSARR